VSPSAKGAATSAELSNAIATVPTLPLPEGIRPRWHEPHALVLMTSPPPPSEAAGQRAPQGRRQRVVPAVGEPAMSRPDARAARRRASHNLSSGGAKSVPPLPPVAPRLRFGLRATPVAFFRPDGRQARRPLLRAGRQEAWIPARSRGNLPEPGPRDTRASASAGTGLEGNCPSATSRPGRRRGGRGDRRRLTLGHGPPPDRRSPPSGSNGGSTVKRGQLPGTAEPGPHRIGVRWGGAPSYVISLSAVARSVTRTLAHKTNYLRLPSVPPVRTL
jgi:hypothetical protein